MDQWLPAEVKQAIAKHRFELPKVDGEDSKDSISSMLAQKFGHEDGDYRLFSEQLSGDKKADFKRLLELRDKLKGSKKR
ncbi:hypothetical protein, partial [Escherichia coli]|uniref:hypothetical protein n=1 Tax=Escherichia coli TaxID=562 RepID=UPI003CE6785B